MRYLYFTFLAALWAFNPSRVTAQCTFTSTLAGGDWSSPTTWIRTGTGCGTSLIPTPTSAVVINGPVTLDQNVTLNGSTGSLTINSTGSLVEDDSPRTLILGQTTGGNVANRFVLSNGGTFNVSTFEITKSTGTLNGRGTIKCNLYLGNQSSLTINNELVILGNLQLDPGNPALAGTGSVRVVGCVVGSNGALNGVVIAPLRVCVQNLPTSCGTGACNGDVPINNDANCTFLLPVELSAFSAAYEAARRSVQLRWQTASEKDNDRFVIERSANGRDFGAIGTVAGAGTTTSPHSYQWRDERPLAGTSYYRLRQIDRNGQETFSSTVVVSISSELSLQAWPSEVDGHYNLLVRQPAPETAHLQLVGPMGRVVRTTSFPSGTAYDLDLHGLPPGTYVLRIVTGHQVFTQRIAHVNP